MPIESVLKWTYIVSKFFSTNHIISNNIYHSHKLNPINLFYGAPERRSSNDNLVATDEIADL